MQKAKAVTPQKKRDSFDAQTLTDLIGNTSAV
jgi:hypothetical protein